tara:strand:- start:966 stop:1148 length:183 start_codon:yes stop_codon:yes gene_type:complete
VATFGRNLTKWVNPALEEPHVSPDLNNEALLPPDDTTGATLVMQTTGDIPTALIDTYCAY